MKISKTNALRELDKAKINYQSHLYDSKVAISAVEVAAAIQQPVARVYKTLVTIAKSNRAYVFVIPVTAELNLKLVAASRNEKSLSMLPQKELLPLTGYVHGGCSPVGMKNKLPTTFDSSALLQPSIIVSAGKIGQQLEIDAATLIKYLDAQTAAVIN